MQNVQKQFINTFYIEIKVSDGKQLMTPLIMNEVKLTTIQFNFVFG